MRKTIVEFVYRGQLVRLEGDPMLLRSLDAETVASALAELHEKNGAFPRVVRVS